MKNIGIIGFGNMGQAIAGQLRPAYKVLVFDKDREKLQRSEAVSVCNSAWDLIQRSDAAILAVKPQDFMGLLSEIRQDAGRKLIISIAAGVTTASIEAVLGAHEVVRAMPNMPASIGCGMTSICMGRFAGIAGLDFSEEIFSYLGEVLRIDEGMMNAATAVSGSGPAYVCYFSKQKEEVFLSDFLAAAEAVGFNREEAALLTKTTYFGTKEYLKKNAISAEELIKRVASKGGTTEAALEVLDKGGSLTEAVKAALKRAEELSR